ncbi:MAG TPA: DUF423 domain-containing protein [Pirellulales bacterium]|nr:DUF423 domain-containing protein [Pirellulales bacterium]
MWWVACGAVLAGLSVAAGAFGAHGLKGRLAEDLKLSADESAHQEAARRLEIFDTAARYHMYHAIAVVLIGLAATRHSSIWLTAGGSLFVAGILVFCGCLYAMALGAPRILGAVVPFGGVGFILGWICLAIGAVQAASEGIAS